MASRILYLEVDDEITSAAARIRGTEASRVAVVLPNGSRVATSRINFRLLSRDALTHEKRISIVSGDSATRALAASAGLPVFSSVAEYESSLTGPDDETAAADAKAATAAGADVPGPELAPETAPEAAAPKKAGKGAKAVAGAGTVAAAGAGAAPTVVEGAGVAPIVASAVPTSAPAPATSAAGVTATTLWGDEALPGDTTRTVRRDRAPTGDPRPPTASLGRRGESVAGPVAGTSVVGRSGSRAPLAIGLAILALAIIVAGVGAFLLLPSAAIAVTPRTEAVGPVSVTVIADPAAPAPDAAAGVVPASEITIPVAVNQTFPSTGTRVEETKATGTVRFENLDPTASNTIASGSIVRTNDDIRFRTDAAVTVPRADLVGLTIFPSRASVKVTAVDGGTDGNVEANRITEVPRSESGVFLRLTNPDPTEGGTREEFPRVVQADIDTAMGTLNTMLAAAFSIQVQDPALATGGATVIAETADLGLRTPTVDPATLVGQEVPTFDLGLSANGTVMAVDAAPVASIAESQLRAAVKPNYELVADSIEIEVGPAIVTGGTVRFEATAGAEQVAILDADALKQQVLGLPVDEARSILAPYGSVEVSVWPEWVSSIPTFGSRVDLTVVEAVEIETPSPSPSGSAP